MFLYTRGQTLLLLFDSLLTRWQSNTLLMSIFGLTNVESYHFCILPVHVLTKIDPGWNTLNYHPEVGSFQLRGEQSTINEYTEYTSCSMDQFIASRSENQPFLCISNGETSPSLIVQSIRSEYEPGLEFLSSLKACKYFNYSSIQWRSQDFISGG